MPESLREIFANFPPSFENTLVNKNDIDDLLKTYAEEEGIMSQLREMLTSSFTLQKGTLIFPPLLFYLELGLVCTKIHRSIEYSPRKCFNSFVQSAVDATRQRDNKPNSRVVAETMKLPSNSSFGYQIMLRSRHTLTKNLNDEKTHAALNVRMFNKLNCVNNALFEVELAKGEIERKEPINIGVFHPSIRKTSNVEILLQLFQ